MISKALINKCLFFLNKVGHKYHNVSYSIARFDNFVSLAFQIWDTNRNIIVKTFVKYVSNYISFENMKTELNEFIKDNNRLLC